MHCTGFMPSDYDEAIKIIGYISELIKKNLRNIILCELKKLQEEPQRMMLSFYQASWSF